MAKNGTWKMPDWMKPYAPLFVNTGTNEDDRVAVVEEMYNGRADPVINLPLSTLQACVKSQVGLLCEMEEAGLLLKTEQVNNIMDADRQRGALLTIKNSVALVLASRAFPKQLRNGMQAIIDQADAGIG